MGRSLRGAEDKSELMRITVQCAVQEKKEVQMATKGGKGKGPPELDRLIEEIIVDAYDDDGQLWAFRQAFEDNVAMPAEAFVVGEPVTVMTIDYDGNERRGLTARCGREAGLEQVIA